MRKQASQALHIDKSYHLIEDFPAYYSGWHVTGDAFGAGPATTGADRRRPPRPADRTFGIRGRPQRDAVLSPPGGDAFANVHARPALSPLPHGGTKQPGQPGDRRLHAHHASDLRRAHDRREFRRPIWRTIDVTRWKGHRAYIEISDSAIPLHNPPKSPPDGTVPAISADAYVVVQRICASDSSVPPPLAPHRLSVEALETAGDAAAVADAYQSLLIQELDRWNAGKGELSADGADLLDWMLRHGLLDDSQRPPTPESQELAALLKEYRQIEATLPDPCRAPGPCRRHWRGRIRLHSRQLQDARRLVAAPAARIPGRGVARRVSRRQRPPANWRAELPIRRTRFWPACWSIASGSITSARGIVRTPDDFGRMGEPPTHPELLDYLAAEFVRQGFSIKKMHRLMLLSSTYQMSSRPIAESERRDPDNRLLHRMPVRRLEAEAVRDAILALSGRLDERMYGPGVLPYLTLHMEGRGKPKSGPLDGAGRRSIYLNVRRNFLNPLLLAFDYPVPFSTVGRRSVSSVPAQALR